MVEERHPSLDVTICRGGFNGEKEEKTQEPAFVTSCKQSILLSKINENNFETLAKLVVLERG